MEFVRKNECDLLVVGVIRRSALYEFIFGNPIDRLIPAVPCAVHFVKPTNTRF
jgi:nucleotide-binding universal stress UspA family protein